MLSAILSYATCRSQGCNYASLAIGASGGTIYAVGSDGKLKALEDDGSVELRVAADVEVNCTITQIALPPGPPPPGPRPRPPPHLWLAHSPTNTFLPFLHSTCSQNILPLMCCDDGGGVGRGQLCSTLRCIDSHLWESPCRQA